MKASSNQLRMGLFLAAALLAGSVAFATDATCTNTASADSARADASCRGPGQIRAAHSGRFAPAGECGRGSSVQGFLCSAE